MGLSGLQYLFVMVQFLFAKGFLGGLDAGPFHRKPVGVMAKFFGQIKIFLVPVVRVASLAALEVGCR